jgi:hypothetical protein
MKTCRSDEDGGRRDFVVTTTTTSPSCDALASDLTALCTHRLRSDDALTPMDVANILTTLAGTLFGMIARDNDVSKEDGMRAIAELVSRAFVLGHDDAARLAYLKQLNE